MEKWIFCENAKSFDVHPLSNLAQFLFSKLVLNYRYLTVLSHTLIPLVQFIPADAITWIFISFNDEWISGMFGFKGYHTNQKPYQSSSSSVVNFYYMHFHPKPAPTQRKYFCQKFQFRVHPFMKYHTNIKQHGQNTPHFPCIITTLL